MIRSALSLLTLVLITIAFSGVALAQSAPEFKLGFKALADQIPDVVGTPLENQHSGANGDALQLTTTGLMAWRKADNWTAFTDGSTTWINGPMEVQSRPNNQLFSWESPASPAPASPTPGKYVPLPQIERPEIKEVNQYQPTTFESWETYNPDDSVAGRFFEKIDLNIGLGSPDKGYYLNTGIYNSFNNLGGESSFGKPTSREFQVNGVTYQMFEKGTIKFENGQGIKVPNGTVQASEGALNVQAPPDTPQEVASSDNGFNKTYTFGGGKIRIINGPDISVKVINTSTLAPLIDLLNKPSLTHMKTYTYGFPKVDWTAWSWPGESKVYYKPDLSNYPEIDRVINTAVSGSLFNPQYSTDNDGSIEYFVEAISPQKDGYALHSVRDINKLKPNKTGNGDDWEFSNFTDFSALLIDGQHVAASFYSNPEHKNPVIWPNNMNGIIQPVFR